MRAELVISSQAEMLSFAQKLAPDLTVGDLLLLDGPLGAGKTFLAQEIIRSLGVDEQVTSPTFVMVKSYSGKFTINHIDAYRLLDLPNLRQAFDELDIDIDSSLTIVEWGGDFDLNGNALKIEIRIDPDDSRTLTLTGSDSRWAGLKV